jgi:hypothetical protein
MVEGWNPNGKLENLLGVYVSGLKLSGWHCNQQRVKLLLRFLKMF